MRYENKYHNDIFVNVYMIVLNTVVTKQFALNFSFHMFNISLFILKECVDSMFQNNEKAKTLMHIAKTYPFIKT